MASIEQYSEKDACEFAKGLLEAVQFMDDHGIAHRDLKVRFVMCPVYAASLLLGTISWKSAFFFSTLFQFLIQIQSLKICCLM